MIKHAQPISLSAALLLKSSLLFLFSFLGYLSPNLHAQDTLSCVSDVPIKFTGTAENTLCDDYGNLTCQVTITSSNNQSSTFGSNLTGVVVCIQSDFTIDADFEFNNCTVIIDPGVSINAGVGVEFKIVQSKLFACDDLWAGIDLAWGSRIDIFASDIEDAEIAVHADNWARLSLSHVDFNRNRTGIKLSGSWLFKPKIISFIQNDFTCDAPLNGTQDEVSFAGIHLNKVPLYAKSQLGVSRFEQQEYGIFSEGYNTVAFRAFFFEEIYRDGVFLERGNVVAQNSSFKQFYDRGIAAYDVRRLDVSNCFFKYDNAGESIFGEPAGVGVYVEDFDINSSIQVRESNFEIDGYFPIDDAYGVYIKAGTNVGENTDILVFDCDFTLDADDGSAIQIEGTFPNAEDIRVEQNFFDDCKNARGLIRLIDGDKNNVNVVSNYVDGNNTTVNPFIFPSFGIHLEGSSGTNNEVSTNGFAPDFNQISSIANAGRGIRTQFFHNTRYCDNVFREVTVGIDFADLNLGTELLANTFIGGSRGISLFGIIGNQGQEDGDHNGNVWLRKFSFITPLWHAECLSGNCDLSPIRVHTDQQTTSATTPVYFPENVNPLPGWFIIDYQGTPVSVCANQLTGGDPDLVFLKTADGTLTEAAGTTWEAERYLYRLLEEDPLYQAKYTGFPGFYSVHANGTIGQFNAIKNGIEAAHKQPGLLSDIVDIDNERTPVEQDLDNVDLLIDQNGVTPALLAQKEALLEDLEQLDEEALLVSDNYKNSIIANLQSILTANQGVVVSSIYELNEKTVNTIYLQAIINQGGDFTNSQLDDLIEIAIQCPQDGGMAVYRARGLLPYCIRVELEDKFEACNEDPKPEDRYLTAEQERQLDFEIYPNPTRSYLNINLPVKQNGQVEIYDSFGKQHLSNNFSGQTSTLSIQLDLPAGLYYCTLTFESGMTTSKSFIVQ